ncbi:MAG: response regulator transcription factor [Nitrospiraceae bacterium]|jgi:DNA-binding NarL/FixJ family response regulator|uniref:response regulator n=1 Tax=Nitrospira cf. moscoviensis SBR1015 TaxID=96242 RepID=UPI000A0B07FB|nr:response regulator transcription factor [Nitrospira cf. moscoviensis SBR1015]MBY0249485.1 response regulator transcription factor [Nitrospiraceae bacterium]OQW33346.1 MAG: DNA-binding response regulator [Nitrospira sp. SG-bin2]
MRKAKLKTVRVLLVDDHEIVRVGLRTVLSQHRSIQVAGEAATVAEAIRHAAKLKPDVVLMDVRLPDGSGVDACRDILASSPAIRVIILTSYADDDSVLAAVLAGAHGYVLKEIDSTSLTSAIQAVSEGRSILDPAVTDRALGWLRGLAAGADIPGAEKLSAQEERVLALVAEGQTNKEIATALDLSDKTVKNYLANIFHKLHITRRAQAAVLFVKRQA